MKKVVALVLSLTIVMTFFAFNVEAAVVDPVSMNFHYGERTFNTDLTISISTREMYPLVDGSTQANDASNSTTYKIIVILRFMNSGNSNQYVSNAEFTMSLESVGSPVTQGDHLYGPVDIQNFSSDMQMTFNSYYNAANFTVAPSEEFAYDGGFIVPAHDCIRAVAVVDMPAVYYPVTGVWGYSEVYNVTVSQNINVTTTTNAPASLASVVSALDYGNYRLNAINNTVSSLDNYLRSAIDYQNYRVNEIWSDLEDWYDYMTDSQTGVPHIVYDLDNIWTHLYNIQQLLTWSGSMPSYGDTPYSNTSVTYQHVSNNFVSVISRTVLGSYTFLENTDIELPNIVYSHGVRRTLVQFDVNTTVTNQAFIFDYLMINLVNSADVLSVELVSIDDDILSPAIVRGSGKFSIYLNNPSVNSYDPGKHYLSFNIAVYTSADVTPTFPTIGYQYKNIGGADDTLIGQSNDIANASDQIHQQETQWYNQNSQAMQSVGLSNYQYSQQQYNGILGVTFQFEQLWQALGSWNLVYIFVLMLSLATFIIRHRPTTKMQQRQVEAEFYRNANIETRLIKDPTYRTVVSRRLNR